MCNFIKLLSPKLLDYYNEWDNIKIVYRVANKMFQFQSNHATFSDLELPWRLFRCARLTDGNRLYLCNTAHAFNWHSASRGPSATAELLIITAATRGRPIACERTLKHHRISTYSRWYLLVGYPHLVYVATLPCETLMSKNRRYITR